MPGGQYHVITSMSRRPAWTAGSVEGEAAQRFVGLIGDGAVGHDLTRLAQRRVVGEVLALDAGERVLVVVARLCGPAEDDEFECFEVHEDGILALDSLPDGQKKGRPRASCLRPASLQSSGASSACPS